MKKKILIVVADFYDDISDLLIKGAKEELTGFKKIDIIKVPGAFEIPVTIAKNIKKYDGFLALGAIVKGRTPHFDFISKSVIDAIMKLSVTAKKPIGNGIITAQDSNLAWLRSSRYGEKAAKAVISILKQK